MKIQFQKYQATGNDFVLIDNREGSLSFTTEQVRFICDRKFGVGADGLMLIEKHPVLHFNLNYFNSDGSQSLCGNGSRAAVRFAAALGLVNGKATFNAYDGPHDAELLASGIVRLRMNDVESLRKDGTDWFVNTGSPHVVRRVEHVRQYNVVEAGSIVRYSDKYKPGGTNVNFVELQQDNTIFVRTYERGVENETLSCGTGVTAAALVVAANHGYKSPVNIETMGGNLAVEFKVSHTGTFSEIFLVGPAKMVFEGVLEL